MEKTLNLIKNDPWLEPYKDAIVGRFEHAMDKNCLLYTSPSPRDA